MRRFWLPTGLLLCTTAVLAQTQTKLVGSDAAAGDQAGSSVSVYEDTVVVGAARKSIMTGAAYVYVRDADGTWSEQAKLTAFDGETSDMFGTSVSLYRDTAVIGAGNENHDAGSAYVFTRDTGGTWTFQQKLTASDAAQADHFGYYVAVWGDTAVITAYCDDDSGNASGSAYFFTRDGGVWSELIKVTASDAAAEDYFGWGVSLWDDTAVIGSYGDDDNGSLSGSAYVFIHAAEGAWTEQAKLTASDGAASDMFGKAVSISDDTAVIGAKSDDDYTGAVYIFTRDAIGVWSEQVKLTASDAASESMFGASVSVYSRTAMVGTYFVDRAQGAVYLFSRDAAGTWSEQAKISAFDAAPGDGLGVSLSVWGDTAVAGANGDDDGGDLSGAAYVFYGGPIGLVFADGFESGDTTAWSAVAAGP